MEIRARKSELKRAKSEDGEPRVSDHALIRYIERIKGFDMDLIRKEVLTPNVVDAMKSGVTAIKISGVSFAVKNRVIITVKT